MRAPAARTSAPPRRLKASHDEHVPSLAVLTAWNTEARDICVTAVAGKGLGVRARRDLPVGTTVARYEFRVVRRATTPPGDYRVEVGLRGYVGKLDARSFGRPVSGVAQVGALLNEPSSSAGEQPTCVRAAPTVIWGAGSHRRGAFTMCTVRAVVAGEELTWDYGASYGRRVYRR